jgi:hypothetical protein
MWTNNKEQDFSAHSRIYQPGVRSPNFFGGIGKKIRTRCRSENGTKLEGIERNTKTGWRWTQSRANFSPGQIPC